MLLPLGMGATGWVRVGREEGGGVGVGRRWSAVGFDKAREAAEVSCFLWATPSHHSLPVRTKMNQKAVDPCVSRSGDLLSLYRQSQHHPLEDLDPLRRRQPSPD